VLVFKYMQFVGTLCSMIMFAYIAWLWFAGGQSTKLTCRGRNARGPKGFYAGISEHERDTETETKLTWNILQAGDMKDSNVGSCTLLFC